MIYDPFRPEISPERKKIFPPIFEKTDEKYRNRVEKESTKEKVIKFLELSEKKRRLGCWGRIKWERKGEWKVGKEWENVLSEILEMKNFFGENSEIFLSHPDDDKNGTDLIIYINKEKNLLLAVDLTLNGENNILENKFVNSYYQNPVELKIPPEKRKKDPKAFKFVFAIPQILGKEAINRFFDGLEKNKGNLKNFKEDQDFQKDELILVVLFEFLRQMNGQLDKLSQKQGFFIYQKNLELLKEVFSNCEKELEKTREELSAESKKAFKEVENYLNNTPICQKARKFEII